MCSSNFNHSNSGKIVFAASPFYCYKCYCCFTNSCEELLIKSPSVTYSLSKFGNISLMLHLLLQFTLCKFTAASLLLLHAFTWIEVRNSLLFTSNLAFTGWNERCNTDNSRTWIICSSTARRFRRSFYWSWICYSTSSIQPFRSRFTPPR